MILLVRCDASGSEADARLFALLHHHHLSGSGGATCPSVCVCVYVSHVLSSRFKLIFPFGKARSLPCHHHSSSSHTLSLSFSFSVILPLLCLPSLHLQAFGQARVSLRLSFFPSFHLSFRPSVFLPETHCLPPIAGLALSMNWFRPIIYLSCMFELDVCLD